jgi:predicted esterase
MKSAISAGILVGLLLALPSWGQSRYQPQPDPLASTDIPYTRYSTRDKFDRRITFYVSGNANERLPLVLVVLGSGPFSNFRREDDRIVDAHGTVRRAFGGVAHVLAVEKPEVQFLEQPSHQNKGNFRGSPAFQSENTLARWVEAVSAALRAARKLPQIDPTRTLIIGHSEGALVAAMLAQKHSFVTHAALLAGTGPPLKHELERKASLGRLYPELGIDPARQMAKLKQDIAAMRRDPDSATKLAIGHTHAYWAGRLDASAMKILSGTKAHIFLAHGTADQNILFTNFEVMLATLRKNNLHVNAMPVEGADHGFRVASPNGMLVADRWNDVIERIRYWFQPEVSSKPQQSSSGS